MASSLSPSTFTGAGWTIEMGKRCLPKRVIETNSPIVCWHWLGLSRSNLPPEVKCPGGMLLRSKLSPGHFTSKQTVRPGHFTSKESDPLRSRLSPLQGDILLRPGDNLLRSRVSGGQFTSK